MSLDRFDQILIILSDVWNQVNFKELINEPYYHTKLMFSCKTDTIIYILANVPDIMVDLLNNKYYKKIFKIAKIKKQHRENPEVFIGVN